MDRSFPYYKRGREKTGKRMGWGRDKILDGKTIITRPGGEKDQGTLR